MAQNKSLAGDLVAHWVEAPTEEGRGRGGGGDTPDWMLEWRQKSKAPKIPRAYSKTQQNPWTKILPPKKFHVEFPNLKHFQKALLIK